jgi:predicted ArsR family transcriptional regulator
MNLLTQLLYAVPPAPPPKKVRRVVAKEMREREQFIPVRDSSYGTVQPSILKLLGQPAAPMTPQDIGFALNLNKDAVRRGLRSLHSQGKIVQVRKSDQGRHIPSLWKIA